MIGGAVAGATAGLIAFTRAGTAAVDAAGKQAQALGLAVDEYGRLTHAADAERGVAGGVRQQRVAAQPDDQPRPPVQKPASYRGVRKGRRQLHRRRGQYPTRRGDHPRPGRGVFAHARWRAEEARSPWSSSGAPGRR
jgi:hypothetical protein